MKKYIYVSNGKRWVFLEEIIVSNDQNVANLEMYAYASKTEAMKEANKHMSKYEPFNKFFPAGYTFRGMAAKEMYIYGYTAQGYQFPKIEFVNHYGVTQMIEDKTQKPIAYSVYMSYLVAIFLDYPMDVYREKYGRIDTVIRDNFPMFDTAEFKPLK